MFGEWLMDSILWQRPSILPPIFHIIAANPIRRLNWLQGIYRWTFFILYDLFVLFIYIYVYNTLLLRKPYLNKLQGSFVPPLLP